MGPSTRAFASDAEIVVDNGDPGTSSAGSWRLATNDQAFGGSALIAKGSGSYAFAGALAPGEYRIHLWWTAKRRRSSHVPVTVETAGGAARLTVDQRRNGGRWNLLGAFDLDHSARLRIDVPHSGTVCADAVRFELVAPAPGSSPAPAPPAPPPPAERAIAIAWDAPLVNAGGTACGDLAGFRLHAGTASGQYSQAIDAGNATQYTLTVSGGTYFFALTAYDGAGNESLPSAEITTTIEPASR